jgi:hypothetical protein
VVEIGKVVVGGQLGHTVFQTPSQSIKTGSDGAPVISAIQEA